MAHDPYTPPASKVGDAVAERGKRPTSVNMALILLTPVLLSQLWRLLVEWRPLMTGEISEVFFVFLSVRAGFFLALLVLLAKGQSWARHVALAWMLYTAVTFAARIWQVIYPLPDEVRLQFDYVSLAASVLLNACALAALYLLYVPGREWFRRTD